jgi:hypothetical protein
MDDYIFQHYNNKINEFWRYQVIKSKKADSTIDYESRFYIIASQDSEWNKVCQEFGNIIKKGGDPSI